jgi:hypothetical protein
LLVADLVPFDLTPDHVSQLAERFELDGALPEQVIADSSGAIAVPVGDSRIGIGRHGEFDVTLATRNRDNRTTIAADRTMQIAHAALQRLGVSLRRRSDTDAASSTRSWCPLCDKSKLSAMTISGN